MKGVNRAIHDLLEQRLVDQLLALDSRQAFEYVTHHDDQVMGTINLYLNFIAAQRFFAQLGELRGIHRKLPGATNSGARW